MPEKKDEKVDTRQNEDGSEKSKYVLRLFVCRDKPQIVTGSLQNLKKLVKVQRFISLYATFGNHDSALCGQEVESCREINNYDRFGHTEES